MSLRRSVEPIEAVAVAVPVNNEAELLGACIRGINAAILAFGITHPDVAVAVCFGLDRCVDDSALIVRNAGYPSFESATAGVGAARAVAASAALGLLATFRGNRVLLVSTDADSVVPTNWLTHHVELADLGADLLIGSVHPGEELDRERRRAWRLTHDVGQALGHVHGANLAVRADVYRSVGGYSPLCEHEDVDLANRVKATGAHSRSTELNSVRTSGRLQGRTDGGYARYLRDELIPLADPVAPA